MPYLDEDWFLSLLSLWGWREGLVVLANLQPRVAKKLRQLLGPHLEECLTIYPDVSTAVDAMASRPA